MSMQCLKNQCISLPFDPAVSFLEIKNLPSTIQKRFSSRLFIKSLFENGKYKPLKYPNVVELLNEL